MTTKLWHNKGMHIPGIGWAIIAMVSWGLGDFLIQRVSRLKGIWPTLFFISIIGSIGLLPFVWRDFGLLASPLNVLIMATAAFLTIIASVFDFEALKEGKLAVMEPIFSTELPLAAIFAVILWHETLLPVGWLLIAVIFIGVTLAATQHHSHLQYHKRLLEKGVVFALVTAVLMALVDLFMGISSQGSAPLLTVWTVWFSGAIVSFIYMATRGELGDMCDAFKEHPREILALGIFDTMGWVGFCMATSQVSIAITTAIGQSYIIITITLGLLVNHETLKSHQRWGMALAVLAVIILAVIST